MKRDKTISNAIIKVPKNSIKEAFDNLPSGVCFFNHKGRLVLCNKKMFDLCFNLTHRELQVITDLQDALHVIPVNSRVIKLDDNYFFPDGTIWRFSCKKIEEDNSYTEYIASNVTTLFEKQKALKQSTIDRELMGNKMRQISNNVVVITREEEILSMKMLVHNKVGEALQRLRHFKNNGLPLLEKDEVISIYEDLVLLLMGEIDNDDELDDLNELLKVADTLGIKVIINGNFPTQDKIRNLVVMCLRESITNTIRHAEGNLVTLSISENESNVNFEIVNNGMIPNKNIVEGGGLTSLRKRIEMIGGTMEIDCKKVFKLIVTIHKARKDLL